MDIKLRKATESDIPDVLGLIRELAAFEKAPEEVTVTPEDLRRDGFRENPIFEIILAQCDSATVGMAFYFFSYSTWKGKCVYLEDIIVKEAYRGQNIGKMLFEAVIMKSKEISAKRMQWQVLDWNTQAIDFYKKYNASVDNSWLNGRLTEEQIIHFQSSYDIFII
jgi:GNAT superfamily N-acetyltransferase